MRGLLKPRAGRSQTLTVNESEKRKGAPGWVSRDPGAADRITLQGKACRALTGDKLTEQVWTVTPPPIPCYEPSGESARPDTGEPQVKVSTVPYPIAQWEMQEGEQEVSKHPGWELRVLRETDWPGLGLSQAAFQPQPQQSTQGG